LSTLNELGPISPEATARLKEETEKIIAKLGSETDDLLGTDQLAQLGDLLETASQRGSVSAQMLLGKSYLASDPPRAFKYFYLAATDGKNSEAMYKLGDMYASGHGVEGQDIEKAVGWFKQAADLLYPPAIYALGECYYFGKGFGGKPDYARACELLQLAANIHGNRYAQMLLGDLYHDGKLGNANYVEAARLWEAAATQGLEDARTKLIVMIYNGEIVNGKPVTGRPDRDKADRKAAFEQFKESASKGNRSSMFYYAMCLLGGVPGVVKPDEAAGRKQMVIAAERGDLQAQEWCRKNGEKFAPPPR
jgi:TPR repeat protein